jgi:hypothetical protein
LAGAHDVTCIYMYMIIDCSFTSSGRAQFLRALEDGHLDEMVKLIGDGADIESKNMVRCPIDHDACL